MGRRAAGLIALALLVAVAAAGAWQIGGHYRFHDVWCFYHGGRAVLLHADPYDPAVWGALTADQTYVVAGRLVAAPCPGAFAYPYWTAVAFAPLALLPFDVASLIGCGVMTGVGAALKTAKVAPGSSVVVIGCGGVGISVIQGARIAGAAKIVALDVIDERLEFALTFGATHTVNANDEDWWTE